MAESMTPAASIAAKEREAVLKRIAKLAKHQGSFHLACKKYTQVLIAVIFAFCIACNVLHCAAKTSSHTAST